MRREEEEREGVIRGREGERLGEEERSGEREIERDIYSRREEEREKERKREPFSSFLLFFYNFNF